MKAGIRDDGLAVRVEDMHDAGGVAVVFASTGFLPRGLILAGVSAAVGPTRARWCRSRWAPSRRRDSPSSRPSWHFRGASRPCRGSASRRALTVGSSGARLTNAQATFL